MTEVDVIRELKDRNRILERDVHLEAQKIAERLKESALAAQAEAHKKQMEEMLAEIEHESDIAETYMFRYERVDIADVRQIFAKRGITLNKEEGA
jgi:fructose-1,6-bisphosphatase